jgi:integrase
MRTDMFERTKYQAGSLTKEPRMRQPDIWVFRWRETAPDGQRIRRKVTVGTVDEYRTESAAKKALAVLRIDTNPEPSKGSHPVLMTMGQLITHYRQHELGPVRWMGTRIIYACGLNPVGAAYGHQQ